MVFEQNILYPITALSIQYLKMENLINFNMLESLIKEEISF